jgi:molybdate transport system permease protein
MWTAMTRASGKPVSKPPLGLVIPGIIGLAFLVLPLAGLLIRAPWADLPGRLAQPGLLAALRLSLQTATLATALCLLFGVPWRGSSRAPSSPAGGSCGRW